MEAVSPVLAEVSGHSARLSQAGTCHWCNCVQTSCPISKTTFSPVASIKHTKGQDWNDAQSFLILFFLKGNLNFKFHHFCFLGWDFAWSPFFFFWLIGDCIKQQFNLLVSPSSRRKACHEAEPFAVGSSLSSSYESDCVRGAVGEGNENLWLLINDRHHFMQT